MFLRTILICTLVAAPSFLPAQSQPGESGTPFGSNTNVWRARQTPDSDEFMTLSKRNGRFWNALPTSVSVRELFLMGITEGWDLRTAEDEEVPGKMLIAFSPGGSSVMFTELVEMVNAAYSAPENRSLPVGWVLMAEMAVVRGSTTRDLVYPALRKHLATLFKGHVGSAGVVDVIASSGIKPLH